MARYIEGATSKTFPFGWAQLNSDNNLTAYNNPASAGPAYGEFGEWEPGFASIRLAQTNALSLPNTFQAVILDTPVASGSVRWYQVPAFSWLDDPGRVPCHACPPPMTP